jgi:hypothetical protein
MMHRLPLNADRNIGFSATLSTRALKVEGTSLAVFFHHDGIGPQRLGASAGPSMVSNTTSMVVLCAMLYRGSQARQRGPCLPIWRNRDAHPAGLCQRNARFQLGIRRKTLMETMGDPPPVRHCDRLILLMCLVTLH